MAQSQNDGGIITGINVTPLVDVTLVLLVIFIVTSKIMATPAVPIDLPKASSGQEVQLIFSTILTKEGGTFVNGAAIADDRALRKRARETINEDPQLRAVIQADGDVPHKRVMAVMDALKSAGVNRVAFAVSPILPETDHP